MGVAPELDDLGGGQRRCSRQFDTPERIDPVQVVVPELLELRSDLHRRRSRSTDGDIRREGQAVSAICKSTATTAEKTVGFTWSDPAVGPLDADRSTNAVIVGSGYFPDIESLLPGRGAQRAKAGNALYLIDAGHRGADRQCQPEPARRSRAAPAASNGCAIIGDVSNGRKNALQADPTAAGEAGSRHRRRRPTSGDIDGKYWRFDFTTAGAISATQMVEHRAADLRVVRAAVHRHARTSTCSSRPAATCCRAPPPAAPARSSCSD